MSDFDYAGHIALSAHKALLYEALTAPKPGLVDRFDSGAHSDMDIFTFVDSAESLLPYFYRCACAGIEHGTADAALFKTLRAYGLEAERDMLKATCGVNTHKGAILSLGIICAAAGALGSGASSDDICLAAGKIAQPLLDDFKHIDPKDPSYGERQYLEKGRTGIRGEAASGFPQVCKHALPYFRDLLESGLNMNDAALLVLARLILTTDDTTLIKRCGEENLPEVRKQIASVLLCEDMKKELSILNNDWSESGISAGGCADLLGITLFFIFL